MKLIYEPEEPGAETGGELVEVYLASEPIEAAVVKGILDSAGLDARIRDMTVTPYPVTIGPLSEKRIVVPAGQAQEARAILRRAAEDGILEQDRIGHPERSS